MSILGRYGIMGALGFSLLIAVYLYGRSDAARACERRMAQISDQAIEEKAADDALQADNARGDRDALEAENARLRRFLNERNANVETVRNCLERRDADGLRDDYHAIFGERLSPGRGLDGAE